MASIAWKRIKFLSGSSLFNLLFLLPVLSVVSSGCATNMVSKIGQPRHVRFSEVKEVRVGSDGSIAVETALMKRIGDKSEKMSYRRYLIGSPEVVRQALESDGGDGGNSSVSGSKKINIYVPKSVASGSAGWRMVPDRLGWGDAEYSHLPKPLREGAAGVYSPFESFPYELDGKTVFAEIGSLSLADERRQSRPFWYYPSRVLYVPAVAVDAATAPIQLAVVVFGLTFARQL